MRLQRRWLTVVVASLGVLALSAATGCSQLRSSAQSDQAPTMQEMANRVADLEAQVGDLQVAIADMSAPMQSSEEGTPGAPVEGAGAENASATGASAGGAEAGPMAAAGNWAQVVDAPYLNIRAQADVSSRHIGTLAEGAVVEVLEQQGEWSRVHFQSSSTDITGWVANQYLQNQ